MSRLRMSLRWILWLTVSATTALVAQQPAPPGLPPLFLREEWRQRDRPPDAPANFVPEAGVTSAAVTNPSLELKLYDPNAKSVAGYVKQPPAGSIARDWSGPAVHPTCRLQPESTAEGCRRRRADGSAEPLDRRVPDAGRRDASRQEQLRRSDRSRSNQAG